MADIPTDKHHNDDDEARQTRERRGTTVGRDVDDASAAAATKLMACQAPTTPLHLFPPSLSMLVLLPHKNP